MFEAPLTETKSMGANLDLFLLLALLALQHSSLAPRGHWVHATCCRVHTAPASA